MTSLDSFRCCKTLKVGSKTYAFYSLVAAEKNGLKRVLNESPEQVDARWRAWLKRRYYPEYLDAKQDLPQLRELRGFPTEPEDFSASPDGNLLVVRGSRICCATRTAAASPRKTCRRSRSGSRPRPPSARSPSVRRAC